MFANYMRLRMKHSYFPVFAIAVLVAALQLLPSCANIVPPSGGPRDSLPPVLVRAMPRDSMTHFTSNKIVIEFDEYVTIDNPTENLIVSPYPKNQPQVDGKLRTITVKLRDSLEANTTYAINFGHSIKDVNEGNIARELTYVFSTGDYIDSNYLEGQVQLAETGKLDTTLIAILHRDLNDSAVYKLAPRYYAKLDGQGHFYFHNLPASKFNLFIMPNDYGKKYDDSTKLFAFSDSAIQVSTHTQPVTLYAYNEYKEQPKKPVTNTNATGNKKKDKSKDEEDKRLKITATTVNGGEQDVLSDMQISFSRPLRSFDSSQFILTDTNYKALPQQLSIKWADTTATKLTLKYPWKPATDFRLIINKQAATDSADINIFKTDTLEFSTKKEAAYGSIKLHFENFDFAKHPILHIIQNDKTVDSVFITRKLWSARLYQPGDYELRILYDTNNDSIWTPGQFWMSATKRQPEIVAPAKPAKINVRSNWDNEWDISPGNAFDSQEPGKNGPLKNFTGKPGGGNGSGLQGAGLRKRPN